MDLLQRFDANPLISPAEVPPSKPEVEVACVLNPGVYRHDGRTHLLLRVAERPRPEPGWVQGLIQGDHGLEVVRVREDDPDLQSNDPRGFVWKGEKYLTTLSHLRRASSVDGIHFDIDAKPLLMGEGPTESFGIEDVRVSECEGEFLLTYSAASAWGVGAALRRTRDWKTFSAPQMIFAPENKDCAIFEQKVNGLYTALHRPVGSCLGGPFIWLAQSPDLVNWGRISPLVRTRPGMWDGRRIGAGAAPIATDEGFLCIIHGADADNRYCLGGLLLDRENPARVLARSVTPSMEPVADYETKGFFGNVVFTNGHVVDGDRITMYYGASDELICGATASIDDLVRHTLQGAMEQN